LLLRGVRSSTGWWALAWVAVTMAWMSHFLTSCAVERIVRRVAKSAGMKRRLKGVQVVDDSSTAAAETALQPSW
jgi:hypothetical protein